MLSVIQPEPLIPVCKTQIHHWMSAIFYQSYSPLRMLSLKFIHEILLIQENASTRFFATEYSFSCYDYLVRLTASGKLSLILIRTCFQLDGCWLAQVYNSLPAPLGHLVRVVCKCVPVFISLCVHMCVFLRVRLHMCTCKGRKQRMTSGPQPPSIFLLLLCLKYSFYKLCLSVCT